MVGYPICEWTDNWYTVTAASEYDRLSGIVMIDQFATGASDHLRALMATDGILGFRLGAICPYDRMWETFDPTVEWLREALSESAFAQYADLAEYDTVYAKLSEVQHRSEETYPYEDMHDYVRWLLDTFGRERLVWGADYPNVSDEATYEECVTWLECIDELSIGDLHWLRGRSFEQAAGL